MTKTRDGKPIVLITGAVGNIGRSLGEALGRDYRVIGLDRQAEGAGFPVFEADFTSDDSLNLALREIRGAYGSRIASVIHLVAYFDFTGEDNPLYQSVNVEGTRRLVRALQDFEVEQFVYSSTMLVHAPCRPGERINEQQPIDPRWAYPKSKAAAEAVIRSEHNRIPYVILRLAGVYDERSMVPTLAQQMARIYERDFQSYLYAGSTLVGQAMLHRRDMLDAFRRTVDRRAALPSGIEILVGEPDAVGYDALQDELGYLIHGTDEWPTLRVPKPLASAGSWVQARLEPVIPDVLDGGEKPFIRPFMVGMADDHYALDIRRARDLLGWEPQHHLKNELPELVATLKGDPAGWYEANKVTPPEWIGDAADLGKDPETLRTRHESRIKSEHADGRWAHFVNMGLGTWLVTQTTVDQRRRDAPALGRDRSRPLSHDFCSAGTFLASAVGTLGVRGNRHGRNGGTFPVFNRELRVISFRHSRRYPDLRSGGLPQARSRPLGGRLSHRPCRPARLEL